MIEEKKNVGTVEPLKGYEMQLSITIFVISMSLLGFLLNYIISFYILIAVLLDVEFVYSYELKDSFKYMVLFMIFSPGPPSTP